MFKPEALKAWANELVVQVSEVNKEAGQKALVKKALAEKARVRTGTPRPSSYQQFVDGSRDAPIEGVRYDGVVVLAWQYLREVVQRCFEALVLSSPVFEGHYRDSISILLNDDEGIAGSKLDDINSETEKVTIVPTADYARKLEVGLRRDGTPFVVQVPLHNVEMVARMLASRYRDLAEIEFNYVDIIPAYGPLQGDFPSRKRQPHETHVRYPAIIIIARTI